MKKLFLFVIAICSFQLLFAQQTVESFQKEAAAAAQKQDFDAAVHTLEEGLQQYPDNLDLLKDEAYFSFLGRDYKHALEVGKKIIQRDDADVQTYQILGLTYNAIANYKDGDKMYKEGLKKFPKSAVLYSAYGDMLAQNDNKKAAIEQWEKGIAADGNYSSNYYYTAKYYAATNNIFWSSIYGEIFVNIESLTKRTDEIKDLLVSNYKKLLADKAGLENLKKDGSDFEKAVASSMLKAMETENGDISPEMITAFRSRFLLDWANTSAKSYPYRLFDFHLQLMRNGIFDAYNQWLFGSSINKNKYDNWVYTHNDEMKDFTQFQKNVLFKVPAEQYYGNGN